MNNDVRFKIAEGFYDYNYNAALAMDEQATVDLYQLLEVKFCTRPNVLNNEIETRLREELGWI